MKTDKNSQTNTTTGTPSHPEQASLNTNSGKDATPATRGNVYDRITDRITAQLEKGCIPWRKPWNVQTGFPRNFISKKAYRGINVFLLLAMSYESPFWLTFRQVRQLGGIVRAGEKACPVIFWKQRNVEDEETDERRMIPLARCYHVFNVTQCHGLKNLPQAPVAEASLPVLTQPAEIVARMPQRPEISHGMSKAFYSVTADFVGMPEIVRFNGEAEYYSTLFHELIHASGHQSRLNRPSLTTKADFGSTTYCREELIAEMGAAFLCGHAGIVDLTLDNSAAYISNWLELLRSDRRLIVQAAAQAQKAADFVLGVKYETGEIHE